MYYAVVAGQDGHYRADNIKHGLEISESVRHILIMESIFSRSKESQESYPELGVWRSCGEGGSVVVSMLPRVKLTR